MLSLVQNEISDLINCEQMKIQNIVYQFSNQSLDD